MLQNTLIKLENQLKNSLLTPSEQVIFLDVFKHYSAGKWVYPGALKRITKIHINKIYNVLNLLEQADIITSYFEVICQECKKTNGIIYNSINEIPDSIECDNCGNIDAFHNAFLIYKVNADE
ncbi:hypothetical protein [Robinsoniella peoriensis]|uniref:hypothetical protein n=1 Tax=Robinsoniella peoriensis TaxID=180332 RepID=UPI00363CBF4F